MEVWSPRTVTQEEVDQQQAAASARKEVRHVPYHSRISNRLCSTSFLELPLSRPSSCR